MTPPDRRTRARADWLEAEAAYRAAVDTLADTPEAVPSKNDYIAIVQARARADHKQAAYFKDILRG